MAESSVETAQNPAWKKTYKVVGAILIMSLLAKLAYAFLVYVYKFNFQSYGYSDFLISFEGGFVRRGLFGQMLMWLNSTLGIQPQYVIIFVCLAAYAFILAFFLNKFKAKGYCWWLLLTPLACGLFFFLIRKDYLMYCILIGMLYLVREEQPSLLKRIAAVALGIFCLYLHEAFLFWGIALLAIVMLTQKHQFKVNAALILVILANFAVLSYFKGDSTTAYKIIDAWNGVLPGSPLSFTEDNSIGALSWTTGFAAVKHITANTGGKELYYLGILFWPLCFCAVYYFYSFYFVTFKPRKGNFDLKAQNQLSFLFLFMSVCLFPMFAALSCDYGRLFQYAVIGSLAAFLILDEKVKERMLPGRIETGIQRTNLFLGRQFVPTRGLMITLLLFGGISPCYFDLYDAIAQSPVGSIAFIVFQAAGQLLLH